MKPIARIMDVVAHMRFCFGTRCEMGYYEYKRWTIVVALIPPLTPLPV